MHKDMVLLIQGLDFFAEVPITHAFWNPMREEVCAPLPGCAVSTSLSSNWAMS
jgi:hypothetical protein